MKIAFAKGRGASDCMCCLNCNGIQLPDRFLSASSVVCSLPELEAECYIVRGSDIAWYLENQIVDVAFGSQLLFLNANNSDLELVAGLPFGRCRLSLLFKRKSTVKDSITVATRYPELGKRLLTNYNRNIKWLELTGCLETALLLDVCDAIIDVVETGNSMRKYNLEENRVLTKISHGVWINRHTNFDLTALHNLFPVLNPSLYPDVCRVDRVETAGISPRKLEDSTIDRVLVSEDRSKQKAVKSSR